MEKEEFTKILEEQGVPLKFHARLLEHISEKKNFDKETVIGFLKRAVEKGPFNARAP
jgi:hypothetical protein